MGFVCNLDKEIPFIGREAILEQKESRCFMKKRLVQFLLGDPGKTLYHHEPIVRDGQIVGHLTSGDYGHTLGGAVGLGYIEVEEEISKEYIDAGSFEIDVGGERIPAKASLGAMYDPKAERMRG
jgi:4-methylaminobutanoate oxidase (formaldehyde-forming)